MLSDKCMSLNESNLEKLVVVHCFRKKYIKMKHNVELNFNTAYFYFFPEHEQLISANCLHLSSCVYLSILLNIENDPSTSHNLNEEI